MSTVFGRLREAFGKIIQFSYICIRNMDPHTGETRILEVFQMRCLRALIVTVYSNYQRLCWAAWNLPKEPTMRSYIWRNTLDSTDCACVFYDNQLYTVLGLSACDPSKEMQPPCDANIWKTSKFLKQLKHVSRCCKVYFKIPNRTNIFLPKTKNESCKLLWNL